ncbi:unnamed protein product [Caenorhabditis sp. 36 PRJEB53466]|nr:unnamed protein product [Caenorhabditis sp. 36 PRJEB53466]
MMIAQMRATSKRPKLTSWVILVPLLGLSFNLLFSWWFIGQLGVETFKPAHDYDFEHTTTTNVLKFVFSFPTFLVMVLVAWISMAFEHTPHAFTRCIIGLTAALFGTLISVLAYSYSRSAFLLIPIYLFNYCVFYSSVPIIVPYARMSHAISFPKHYPSCSKLLILIVYFFATTFLILLVPFESINNLDVLLIPYTIFLNFCFTYSLYWCHLALIARELRFEGYYLVPDRQQSGKYLRNGRSSWHLDERPLSHDFP